MGDELYSCDKIEIGAANVSPPVKPGYSAILQEQSNEFEKQAQRRQFNRKKSKMCFVGKSNKTKKYANTSKSSNSKKTAQNEEIYTKARPNCILQQIETAKVPQNLEKSNPRNRNLQKTKTENKQL